MSKLTDHAENKLADFIRGQGLTLPTNWDLGLLSAAADGSFTELAGTDYARVPVARSLAAWAGTQGAGTTLASTGTSHQTSNNSLVDYGTAGSAWGTASHVGAFDASNNLWFSAELVSPIVINSSDPVSFAAGAIVFTLGLTGGMSDYLANKLIDLIWRAQAYSMPANMYAGLLTAAPTNAGGGTEVGVTGYARVAIPSTLSGWSGTQGAGTTVASSGTGGRISNNSAVQFPNVVSDWGTVGWMQLRDALTSGNLMFWRALAETKTVSGGGAAPRFDPDTLGIAFA